MSTETRLHQPRLDDYRQVELDKLDISEANARQHDITDGLDELVASLNTIGLQQPIVVRPKGDDRYEILIGQRRYLAAKRLGWTELTARIETRAFDSTEAKAISFSENAQRRDLSPADKAEACQFLLQKYGSAAAVAAKTGVAISTIRRWLGYALVPEGLKALVEARRISRPLATRLTEYVDDEARAVELGEAIALKSPPKPEQDRILAAIQEAPTRPVDLIFQRAEEARRSLQIQFVLPERWARAIETASKAERRDANDIALDATIDWLTAKNY